MDKLQSQGCSTLYIQNIHSPCLKDKNTIHFNLFLYFLLNLYYVILTFKKGLNIIFGPYSYTKF